MPRPDWYFYFLFYLLRIFKWPESVILGTVGVPTILLILLVAVPFIDRRLDRRLVRRPVAVVAALLVIASMGILTYKGATAEEPSATSGAAILESNDIPADDEQVVSGADLFAGGRLPELPHVRDAGRGRARSESLQYYTQERGVSTGSTGSATRRRSSPERRYPPSPNLTEQQFRGPRHLHRGSLQQRLAARPAVRVFLGITGASGAPYAVRLLEALTEAGAEVGVCASSSGIEVLATELYDEPGLGQDEVLDRVVAGREGVTVHPPEDFRAPYASGSAQVDGYVVCPCSMATLGTLAAGAMDNLIHRAASVAIKEGRRLVLMP